jgi:hypothetical protein
MKTGRFLILCVESRIAMTHENQKPAIVYAKPVRVLIYAAPGLVRDSLCSLIASFSFAQVAGVLSLGSDLPEGDNAHPPDVVLLDTFTNPDNFDLVLKTRQLYPHSSLVVMIETLAQKQLAYDTGADEVLLRGCAGQEFKAVFQAFVHRPRPQAGRSASQPVVVLEGRDESD